MVKRVVCTGLVGLGLLLVGTASWADERDIDIVPGTVLEVYAVGIRDFHYEVPVNSSGEASFPLLDPVNVRGMTLADVRTLVRQGLPTKVYRQRSADGRDQLINILPEEIVVEIASYAPVYITGDVAKPGEIAYKPDLSIRQAVALAGGYGPSGGGRSDNFLEASNIRGEYQAAWIEFATEQTHELALEAVLKGEPAASLATGLDAPLRKTTLDQIAQSEEAQSAAIEDNFQKETLHIGALIDSAQAQLAKLKADEQPLRDALQLQTRTLEEVKQMRESGLATPPRVTEEQRQLTFLQDRLMSQISQIYAASRDSDELQRKLEQTRDQHRIDQLADLEATKVKLASLRPRLRAFDEQLAYLDQSKGQAVEGTRPHPTIVIYRAKGNAAATPIAGDEDTTLQANDVIEVALSDSDSTTN